MSGFIRVEFLEPSSSFIIKETSICKPRTTFLFPFLAAEEELGFALDLLNPKPLDLPLQCIFPSPPSIFDAFETTTDLIQIEKPSFYFSSLRRSHDRTVTDFYLRSLSDRVSALELGFDRALNGKIKGQDRKYKWSAEIKSAEKNGVDQKYKLVTDIKGGKKQGVEKNYKWTAEFKGKGKNAPISHTYSFAASTAPDEGKAGSVKAKKGPAATRVVEIEEPDQATLALRQAFARRRAVAECSKGKRKELSPQDAALIIQMRFRAHLVRRSQMLRELRDLAVAKTKLKEIRSFFTNFSYRRRIASDPEERQRFSEKIIVLLLTVDAIEGLDCMVRAARRSMIDELEAMLDVVDPQPPGKLGSLKRRKFDLPLSGPVQKEMALGVAEVVQLLDQEVSS